MCSILAFDDKPGFSGFGRRENEATEDYVRRHGRYAFDLHAQWEARRHSAHLVRYEDLVEDPESTLRRLLDYLELDAPAAAVQALLQEARTESQNYSHHRTSSSSRESVGRWRRDLAPAERDLVQDIFGGVLQAFGYTKETPVGS
jgi:hypothetical protein